MHEVGNRNATLPGRPAGAAREDSVSRSMANVMSWPSTSSVSIAPAIDLTLPSAFFAPCWEIAPPPDPADAIGRTVSAWFLPPPASGVQLTELGQRS